MLYHVTRDGQNYGPYTIEDLRRYVASGNVLPSDMAKSDEMAEWAPVAQLLGVAAPAGYGVTPPAYAPGMVPYPDPPNLHWGLVLLIGFFTCGLFIAVWDIVQAAWMRKVNPRSNALFLYIAEFALSILGSGGRVALMAASGFRHQYMGAGLAIFVVTFTLLELARFDIRRSMEEHFNGPEPIGLSLSGVMTFFFGSLYFQYHFTRINELKRLARYRGAAI
ncbi:MAG: DUF4339 domain-containing protein [Acidobacteriaceae bacterium]|jgi:hypothetical protein